MVAAELAIDYVLHLEDETMSGNVTATRGDSGGLTRYGLACRWHPELLAKGYFSESMPNGKALPLAMGAYINEYVVPMFLTQLQSQAIANHLLSFAVNDGLEKGISLLQGAINALMPGALKEDGVPGPLTVAAANRCLETSLLACLCVKQIAFHVSLNQPEFLMGWLRRDLA